MELLSPSSVSSPRDPKSFPTVGDLLLLVGEPPLLLSTPDSGSGCGGRLGRGEESGD